MSVSRRRERRDQPLREQLVDGSKQGYKRCDDKSMLGLEAMVYVE